MISHSTLAKNWDQKTHYHIAGCPVVLRIVPKAQEDKTEGFQDDGYQAYQARHDAKAPERTRVMHVVVLVNDRDQTWPAGPNRRTND